MIIEEHISGTVFLRNGNEFSLSDSCVISASTKRQCCADGCFDIGGVFAASLSMVCRIPDTNSFSLRGAKIVLKSRYSDNLSKKRGTFWITDARKQSGDIYSITAQDAVGWLDASSYGASSGNVFDNIAKYFESLGLGHPIHVWCQELTSFTDSLVKRLTGESGALSWQDYDEAANGLYTNHYAVSGYGGQMLTFFLSTEAGAGQSDCPRDLFRHLAYLTGGFIYANEAGKLTLGQFAQPEFGLAEISDSEIEDDSCEIADFNLQLILSSAQSDIGYDAASSTSIPDYISLSPFRICAESNPFLDGFAAAYIRGDGEKRYDSLYVIVENLYYFNHRYQDTNRTELQSAALRPFRCKVHKETEFHLGQKIGISYQGTYHESTITSVTWTFRGGYTLACAGEDSRTMADALRMSMAGKSIKETRNRYLTLENKIRALS